MLLTDDKSSFVITLRLYGMECCKNYFWQHLRLLQRLR